MRGVLDGCEDDDVFCIRGADVDKRNINVGLGVCIGPMVADVLGWATNPTGYVK